MTSSEITVPVNFDLSNKECTISGAVRTYLSCTGTRNALKLVLDQDVDKDATIILTIWDIVVP